MTRFDGTRGAGRGARSIWIGPGERLRPLSLVLAGLGVAVRDIEDLAETATATGEDDIEVVLDADLIPIEDIGYLKRFQSEPGLSRVALVGHDAGTRVVRTVLALPRSRWMPWPPLLDDLIAMAGVEVRSPSSAPATAHERPRSKPVESKASEWTAHLGGARPFVPGRASPRPAQTDRAFAEVERVDEIDEVQGLLDADRRDATETPAAKTPPNVVRIETHDDEMPDFAPEAELDEGASATAATEPDFSEFDPEIPPRVPAEKPERPVNEGPPPWWRAQVADLADAAQRVELGVQALRLVEPDSHEEVREHVDQLDGEVARLVQFARTLGYVASPPSRGDQVFDLADTVQVFVAQLASRPEATPRCQFRSSEPVFVRSDRALLGQAFDAFFWLAGACSAKGDLVRAQVVHDGGPAEVRIEFAAGPLDRIETARILEPYGLRRVLPDLGPNALSAASAIIVGQGGSVELARVSNGRLSWRIVLPAVERPPSPKKRK